MSIIRSIRGGSAGLNEEDRLTIAGLGAFRKYGAAA